MFVPTNELKDIKKKKPLKLLLYNQKKEVLKYRFLKVIINNIPHELQLYTRTS